MQHAVGGAMRKMNSGRLLKVKGGTHTPSTAHSPQLYARVRTLVVVLRTIDIDVIVMSLCAVGCV